MIDWPLALYILMAAAALLSLSLWIYGIRRMLRRGLLLEPEERRAVPWGLVDLALVLLVFAITSLTGTAVVTGLLGMADAKPIIELTPSEAATMLWVTSLSSLLAAGLSLLLVRLRANASGRDIGWVFEKHWHDLALGVVAFFMLAPPVYAVQAILTQWLELESVHPLIQLLQKDATAGLIIAASFSAVIVAPLVEEILFRLLLQGWLEKAALSPKWHRNLVIADVMAHAVQQLPQKPRGLGAWWPILISSLLFAAMHAGHGPDPIPLFLLALGLGYLYQRTHRIVPCIIVHFLLNGCTMLMLFWGFATH